MSPPPPQFHSHAPAAASAPAPAAMPVPVLDHASVSQSDRDDGRHASHSAIIDTSGQEKDRPSTSSSLPSSSSSQFTSHLSYDRPKSLRFYRYKLRWRNGVDLTKPYHAFELASCSSSPKSLFPPPPPVPDTLDLHQFFYVDPSPTPSASVPSPPDTATPTVAPSTQSKTALISPPTTTAAAAPAKPRSPSRGRNQAPAAVPTPAAAPAPPASSANPVAASPKKYSSRSRSRAKHQHHAQPASPPPPVPVIPPMQVLDAAKAPPPAPKPAPPFSWAKMVVQPKLAHQPASATAAPAAKLPPSAASAANDFPVVGSTASTAAPTHVQKPATGAWAHTFPAPKAAHPAPSLSTSTTVTVNALPSKSQSSTAATTPTKSARVVEYTPSSALQFMQPDFSGPTTPEPATKPLPARQASPTPTTRRVAVDAPPAKVANGHVTVPCTPPAPSSASVDAQNEQLEKPADGSPTPTAPRAAPAAPSSWAAAAAGPQLKPPSTPSPPPATISTASAPAVPTIQVTTPTPTSAAPPSEQATPTGPAAPAWTSTESTPTPAAPVADATPEPPAKPKPKPPASWAALFDSGSKPAAPTTATGAASSAAAGGLVSLGDLAATYAHDYVGDTPHARGLVNNGNMCFLNVILQPLIHCPPFRNLLRAVNKRVVAKIGGADGDAGGEAKLIEAFVAFMGEYVNGGAGGAGAGGEHEEAAGDPLVPEPIYDVVRATRSRSLVKGRQEDAEEFLGFLLDGLHDEFVKAIKQADEVKQRKSAAALSRNGSAEDLVANGNGSEWLEVGTKHRTAVTRTVAATESPISSLFAGRIRSTLRVPGQKDSVTSEPFQSLPLDISPDHVRSVPDALHEIIRPETISEYPLPGGRGVVDGVTKQAKLERVPPILVMHLKRFLFDAARGDTVKVTKHVDVPVTLELEPRLWADKVRHQARAASSGAASATGATPRSRTPSPVRASGSAMSPTRFSALAPAIPSSLHTPTTPGGGGGGGSAGTGIGPHSHYRLFAIVYHHGRAANGGHYTCDVLESHKEGIWVRMDDTELQRVTTAEVAQHKHDREPYLLFYECAELVERVERPRGRAIGKPPAGRGKSVGSRASSVGAQGKVNGAVAKVGGEETVAASVAAAATAPQSVPTPSPAAVTAPPSAPADPPAPASTAAKDEQADVNRAIAASLADSGMFPPAPPSPPSPRVEEAEEEMPFLPVATKKQKAKPGPQMQGAAGRGGGRGGGGAGAGRGAGRGGRGKRGGAS